MAWPPLNTVGFLCTFGPWKSFGKVREEEILVIAAVVVVCLLVVRLYIFFLIFKAFYHSFLCVWFGG